MQRSLAGGPGDRHISAYRARIWSEAAQTAITSPGEAARGFGIQAEGYGADIAFDGSTVRITGRGLGKGALGASGRQIPVPALQSVDLEPASALVNGHIELVTAQGKTLVHFRRKHVDSMSAIYKAIVEAVPHIDQGKTRAPLANTLRDAHAAREASAAKAQTPAGWYPDTGDSGKLRWGDGTTWTDHFADDPASAPPVPAPASKLPGRSAGGRQAARSTGQPMVRDLVHPNIVGESFTGGFRPSPPSTATVDAGLGSSSPSLAAIVPDPGNLTTSTPSRSGSTDSAWLGICHATSPPGTLPAWRADRHTFLQAPSTRVDRAELRVGRRTSEGTKRIRARLSSPT